MKNLDKNSYAYKKYIKPIQDREKSIKQEHIKNWFKTHIFDLLNLIIAVLALIVALSQ